MFFSRHTFWALLCAVAVVESSWAQTDAPAKDAQGDPLPEGASARMGLARLRNGRSVTSLAFSRDGKTLISSGHDHTIRLWDASTGQELRKFLGHDGPVDKVVFSPDEKTLASASSDKTVRLWDAATAKEKARLPHPDTVASVAFSPDGKTVVSGGKDKILRIWNVATGKPRHEINAHEDPISAVAFAPDGKMVASSASAGYKQTDWSIRLWDPASGKRLQTLPGHKPNVLHLAFSPDGKTLASGGFDSCIRLWDIHQGKEIGKIAIQGKDTDRIPGMRTIAGLVFSSDGKRLAGTTPDKHLRVWDPVTGNELLKIYDGGVPMAWSPDGNKLAAAHFLGNIRLWDSHKGKELLPLHPPVAKNYYDNSVLSVAFSPDSKTLATTGPGNIWQLWDRASGKLRLTGQGKTTFINQIHFSPDGKMVATAEDGGVQLWDATKGEELRWTPSGARRVVFAFSPDSKLLASGDDGRQVRITDLATGRELWKSEGHRNGLKTLAFSPDGRVLASGGNDAFVRFWDTGSGRELFQFQASRFQVVGLAYAPDSRTLAVLTGQTVNNYGGTLLSVWDLATGKERWTSVPYVGGPRGLAFSPDGRTLAVGSDDDLVHLWDVARAKEIRVLKGYDGYACCVAFSSDGRWLASGNRGGTALIWDMQALGRWPLPLPLQDLASEALEAAWSQLATANGPPLHQAIWKLAGGKNKTVSFFEEQRKKINNAPRTPPPSVSMEQLLKKLDHAFPSVRAEGLKDLQALGPAADPALRLALKGKLGDEARKAIEALLGSRERSLLVPPGETLRWVRVVEVLELIGSPAALDFLQALAKEQTPSYEARQARAALERWQASRLEKP